MSVEIKLANEAEFARELRRIAAFSGKSLEQVIDQQGGLFVRDASAFTPPFGDAPVNETDSIKRAMGEGSVARDTERAFQPLESLKIYKSPDDIKPVKRQRRPRPPGAATGTGPRRRRKRGAKVAKGAKTGMSGNSYGHYIRRVVAKGDYVLATELLRKIRIRVLGVVKQPTDELQNKLRDKRGRIRKETCYVTASDTDRLARFIKRRQKPVGFAKDGWTMALYGFGRKAPGWVAKQAADGIFNKVYNGDTPAVTFGNPVSYIQWTSPRIQDRAWNSRFLNAARQAAILEKAARRKMAELGIPTS